MTELPAGTVTFLFTDIEGSTRLLEQLGAGLYGKVLIEHHTIQRAAFGAFNGSEIDTQGDAFFVSFPRASEAVAAVVQIQQNMAEHAWPEDISVGVRMGLHTGEPWLIEEGYVGMDIHRAARIAHVGHGGQVLLSETTTSLVRDELPEGVRLLDLGRHQLKDIRRPEPIHQLIIPGLQEAFPPLNSLRSLPAYTLTAGAEQILREPRDVGQNPYRGLAAFREADAPFFFGREAFTGVLYEIVTRKSEMATIVGSSGAGKSSVVTAGLLPRLRADGNWLILRFRPGSQPFHALATAVLPILEPRLDEVDRLVTIQKMANALLSREISLRHITIRLLEKSDRVNRVLLLADQFEELYTLCPDMALRQAFIDELLAVVHGGDDGGPSPLVLLLTLRADFMGQALAHRPFADALKDGSLLLGPMNREELQAAIEKPAAKQGAAFETGLVTRILDDVGQEPGSLPLLEFALTLLWDRMDQGWLTHDAYEEIGRVDGALSRHADEVYARLTEEEQAQARRAFVQLVQPGVGTEDTRRIARRDDLVGVNWTLIQRLADDRLVVTGRDEVGNETVEVVHEALIRSWGQFRLWMAEDREFRSWQEGLRASLAGYKKSEQDEGALLRGGPLAQAEAWLHERGSEIGLAEKALIETSVTNRDRRQAERERRRRLIIGGLVVGLVIAVILSVFAFRQRGIAEQNAALAEKNAILAEQNAATAEAAAQARSTQQFLAEAEAEARATQQSIAEAEAEARATQQAIAEDQARIANARNLAAIASEKLQTNPQLGLLLSLKSAESTYSVEGTLLPESATVLHQALRQVSRLEQTIPPQGDGLPYVLFSQDGSRLIAHYYKPQVDLAALSGNTVTRIWDPVTGELLQTLPAGMVAAQWPQGDQVVIIQDTDGEVMSLSSWDIETGRRTSQTILTTPSNIGFNQINGLATSTDHAEVAMSWSVPDGMAIWELPSGNNESKRREIDAQVGGPVYLLNGLPTYLTFSWDGDSVISIKPPDVPNSIDSIIEIRDDGSGERRYFYELPYDTPHDVNRFIAISGNGDLVALPLEEYILIKDLVTWADLTLLLNPENETNGAMTFSPDGAFFAASGQSGNIYVWDLDSSIAFKSSQLLLTLSDSDNPAHSLSFSTGVTRLASAGADGQIKIWDIRPSGGTEVPTIGHPVQSRNRQSNIAVSPDGQRLAISTEEKGSAVWDALNGERLFDLQGENGGVEAIAYSPDGGLIATCSFAGPLRFWRAGDGQALFSLEGYNDGSCSLDFHPGGHAISLGFTKNQSGWYQIVTLPDRTEGGHEAGELSLPSPWRGVFSGELTRLTFDGSGDRLAGITNLSELLVWDPWLEAPVSVTYENDTWISYDRSVLLQDELNNQFVVFSPVVDQLVSTGIDGSVTIWDTQTVQVLLTIQAHTGSVVAAAFSPDGKVFATGSTDGSIKIWDAVSGRNVLNLTDLAGGVTDLAYSPSGDRLYAARGDGTVTVYVMDVHELITLAEAHVTRSLTAGECQAYLMLDKCP